MKGACDSADCRALNTQHFREELMCQRQFVGAPTIARAEDPAAATTFDAVRSIAGHTLKRLRQQGFSKA